MEALRPSSHSLAQSSTLVYILPSPHPPGSSELSQTPDIAVLTGLQTMCCVMIQKGRQNSGDVCTWAGSSFSEEDNGIKEKA